jgi:hypothetical protein
MIHRQKKIFPLDLIFLFTIIAKWENRSVDDGPISPWYEEI